MQTEEYTLIINIVGTINVLSIVVKMIETGTETRDDMLTWIGVQFVVNAAMCLEVVREFIINGIYLTLSTKFRVYPELICIILDNYAKFQYFLSPLLSAQSKPDLIWINKYLELAIFIRILKSFGAFYQY